MKWLKRLFGEQSDRGGDELRRNATRERAVPAPQGVRTLRVGDSPHVQPLPEIGANEPDYDIEIPPREAAGHFATQYSQPPGSLGASADAHRTRMVEIFSDSIRLALDSKNPETAEGRYMLSLAVYHEICAHAAPSPDLDHVTRLMRRVVALYPSTSRMNEATGYLDTAAKLKSAKGKLGWVNRAREVLDAMADDRFVDRDRLTALRARLDEALGQTGVS